MQYKYNKTNNKDMSKFKAIEKMQTAIKTKSFLISTILSIVLFGIVLLLCFINETLVLNNLNVIGKVALSIILANLFLTLVDIFLDSDFLYSYLCKHMDCPLRIKYIDTINDKDTSKNTPGIVIDFDIQKEEPNPIAVTFVVSKNQFYVIGLIDCKKAQNGIKMTFSNEEVADAIAATNNACIKDNKCLTISIMRCKNEKVSESTIVSGFEVDTNFQINEYIRLPLIEKEEASDKKDNNKS